MNIFESYDFGKLKREAEIKEQSLKEKYADFLIIINELLSQNVGDIERLNIRCSDDRISVGVRTMFIVDVLIKDDKFIIREEFTSLRLEFSKEVFPEYFFQIINLKIVPFVKNAYQRGSIEALPEKIKCHSEFDLSKITETWLKETFYEISSDWGNSETIRKIKIKQKEQGLKISFTLECGRYGTYSDNTVTVSNRGYVNTSFAEIIEGGDIESRFRKAIANLIKK
jgi:hypothetical protein